MGVQISAAILIVTNTWNIVMGVFDMAQAWWPGRTGIINSNALPFDISSVMTDTEPRLMEMNLDFQDCGSRSLFNRHYHVALYICIFIVIYGSIIEIYLVT